MAEGSHENFSNFESPFGLERSEGENQNKPKTKPLNENNSVEENGSSKKRRFAVVESKDRSLKALKERRTLATKKRVSLAEMSITRISFIQHLNGIYKEKLDQKLVPIYKFICLNCFFHCKTFTPLPFTLKFRRNF